MAIDNTFLKVLIRAITKYRPQSLRHLKTACLGYPDLIATRSVLAESFGDEILSRWPVSKWASKIRDWHGLGSREGDIFDTEFLFSTLRLEPTFFDVASHRNCEIFFDLNEPLDSDYRHQYDLVIDTGTLEHCFNVGVAFQNMCELTKLEGLIISAAPLSKVNHGFWCFSPTAYFDGFTQNGFKLLALIGVIPTDHTLRLVDLDPTSRFKIKPESIAIAVARRTSLQEFSWPTQSKYLSAIKP